jgi:LysM repeat protein
MRQKLLLGFAILMLLGGVFVGCQRNILGNGIVAEQEEAGFRRGKQRLKEGRPDEALEAFLSVIDHRAQAPESHLEVGLLYLDRFNQPVLAIYHFNEYLRRNPNSEQAERVRQLIVSANKEFARSLPAAPFAGEVDKLDLKELLDKTRAENEDLKTELIKSRDETSRLQALLDARRGVLDAEGVPAVSAVPVKTEATPAPKATPAQTAATEKKAAPAPKTYIVQDGDTLSTIAKKLWGASSRWKELYEANRDTMATPHALKIGQALRIP